jgi:hypothetical protein
MKLIAHRGNLTGKHPALENSPEYIDGAIGKGYDVEIDVRADDEGNLYLGHDSLDYSIDINFLLERKDRLWIHCKDRQALDICLQYALNCFWHTNDDYTLTSNGTVWAYPGRLPTKYKSVMVLPELFWELEECLKFQPYGICSDFVESLLELNERN